VYGKHILPQINYQLGIADISVAESSYKQKVNAKVLKVLQNLPPFHKLICTGRNKITCASAHTSRLPEQKK